MIPTSQAILLIESAVHPLSGQKLHIREARGRILATDVLARSDAPSFDNSQMDGYACHSSFLQKIPATLPLIGESRCGTRNRQTLSPGSVMRIFTGAPMPEGADCVVMQEDCEKLGNSVLVKKEVKPAQYVRKTGEDVRCRDLLLAKGTLLQSAHLGVLASQGIYEVLVYRQPSVGFSLSGDELCFEGEETGYGQIRSCNAEIMTGLFSPWCSDVENYGRTFDRKEDVTKSLEKANQHDLFLFSAGASLGDYDFTRQSLQDLGYKIVFDQVALRPGKPLTLATRGSKIIFGIPGNPVSTYVTVRNFVMKAIYKMQGYVPKALPLFANLAHTFKKPKALEVWAKGNLSLDGHMYKVHTNLNQGSGALGNLAMADCLVRFPEGQEQFEPGCNIEIQLLTETL